MKLLVGLFVVLGVCATALGDKDVARREYERGVKQYNLGEYQTALDAFTKAYDEYPDPTMLFNLAQCHRQLGNKAKAITLYRSYLRETNGSAPNADEVRQLVSSLEQEVARDQASRPQPSTRPPTASPEPSTTPTATPAQPANPIVATEASPPPSRKRRTWIWGIVAAAVVVVGVGIGLGVGLSSHDQLPNADFGSATVH